MNSQLGLELPAAGPSDTVVINARCTLRTEVDQRVIMVGGLAVYHYCVDDAVAEAYAMVMLVESGFAQQTEVARAFGKTERSVRRYKERYGQARMAGLGRPGGWRRGRRRISGKRLRLIERLKSAGLSNRAIAQRLPMSPDPDASDRILDRQLAHVGLLDDAAPMFCDGERISGVGTLLAVPYPVHSGLLRIARKLYGGIGPAFYGLRTTLVTLFLMALLRIQRPEQLKERDPANFGRLLGLDRAPEVKTLRRKLTRLAAQHCAEPLGAELARVRVAQRGELTGFLYVDGHIRAYHGKRTISSAYVARRHLAMPATTDYWINDRAGDPLLLVTADINSSLITTFPNLLRQVRAAVGERQVTIVFDRGGWSPKLFQSMIQQGFDILTYRKHKSCLVNERRFVRRGAKLDGHWVAYDLHDRPVRLLNGKLRLRQITRLCESGLQTQIMTSRWDLRDIEVAHRMFERWRQENFFKYMREEFLLDALVDYRTEPEDPTRTVPNPERRALENRSAPHAPNLTKSSADTEPLPPIPTNTAPQCAASRSPMTSSANNCTPHANV